MPFALLFSIVTPLVSLLLLPVVARVSYLRPYRRFIVPAGAVLSLIGVLFVPLEPTRVAIPSRWQPSIFFGAHLALLAGPAERSLTLALACAVSASALVQLGRIAEPRFSLGVAVLGMLAAGLTGLWAENLLAVLVAWAAFDLAWGLGAAASGLRARRVVLGVGLNGLASVVLWAGTLVVEGRGGGLSWGLMELDGLGGRLLLAAGLLRLGPYPFTLALPAEEGRGLPGAAPLLLGPALGWGLLMRLATALGGTLVPGPWLEGLAMATFVAGGLLAWSRVGPGGGWPWASTAAVGAVLWASLRAGDAAVTVLVSGGAAWLLGVVLLHLGRGLERAAPWWSAASVVGGMALVGAPFTLGMVPVAFLAGSLAAPFSGVRVVVYLVGQLLLTAAVARRVLTDAPDEEPAGPLPAAARTAGLALSAVPVVVGGIHPPLLDSSAGTPALVGLLRGWGVVGWALWTVGTAAGGVLFWQERRLRRRGELVLGLLHDFLRLEWLLRLILASLARAAAFLGTIADVVEGAGAILWALAIFLLIMLAVLGR